MPEFQPVQSARIAAIERPRCPNCRHNRMLLSKLETRSSAFDVGTFECPKCGCVQTNAEASDPLCSDTLSWLASELRRPR